MSFFTFREAMRSFRQHRGLGVTAILSLTAALALSGLFLLLAWNAEVALGMIGDRREMVVYLNDGVSMYTSCCTMMLRRFSWTYSTGSSMVMIFARRSRLMRSTMKFRVVVLPLPVGPVTTTSPLGRRVNSSTTGGMRRSSRLRMVVSHSRRANSGQPPWK